MLRYSRRRKAVVGLVILMMVAIAILMLYSLFKFIPVMNKLVEIKNEVKVFIEIEDEGSMIISFLQAKKNGINYAETLGMDEAAGLLQQTLDEEKAEDERLTELAIRVANPRAQR